METDNNGGLDLRRVGIDPDHWFPVARSNQVKRGEALGVSFAGEPVVVVRTDEGEVFALEDRCAHRQVPLSAGTVCGKRLRCGYHGWSYEASGALEIPYPHDPEAAPNRIRSYPCREAYGLVFVFPGASSALERAPFPDMPHHADGRYRTRYLDRRVRCHYSFMHENLMDMNHQFLHRRWMGGIRTTHLATRTGPGRVEADYTFGRAGGKGAALGERFMLGRGPESFQPGARDLMTVATTYPYQSLRFWTAGSTEPALDLWQVYVPVDREQRVNHTFGLMMVRRPRIPGLTHLLWPIIVWFTEGIFQEDRWIVEQEQRAFDAQGADCNHEVSPVIQELRRLLSTSGVPLGARKEPLPLAAPSEADPG